MKIGYSFWGYLGDTKYDSAGNEVSTPDGNAFYSWSIIKGLQNRGHTVKLVMPDRDAPGWRLNEENIFNSFATYSRTTAYLNCLKTEYEGFSKKELVKVFDEQLMDVDLFLVEWRFLILGRNVGAHPEQPDYNIQTALLWWCNEHNKKVVVLDLDYKLSVDDVARHKITRIMELGDKWYGIRCKRVEIPFDFKNINDHPVMDADTSLVYVGNKYERDRTFNKYVVQTADKGIKTTVYGKWEPKKGMENISFVGRIQASKMHDAYKDKKVTVLLAKDEYYRERFMTARILESIFYGCVPLFPEEFGNDLIAKYAGKYLNLLKVSSSKEVAERANMSNDLRKSIILYLRSHLEFMDSDNFCKILEDM